MLPWSSDRLTALPRHAFEEQADGRAIVRLGFVWRRVSGPRGGSRISHVRCRCEIRSRGLQPAAKYSASCRTDVDRRARQPLRGWTCTLSGRSGAAIERQYQPGVRAACNSARPAMAAVSARRMRGPRLMRCQQMAGRCSIVKLLGRSSRLLGRSAARRGRAEVRIGVQPRVPARRRSGGSGASRASSAPSRTGSWIWGMVRRSLCSAASMAMARRRSRFTRAALVRCGDHGLDGAHAQLGGFLHDEVGGVALQQREDQP